ncbi:hypothetical protein [Streptomyces anulatus]|uniref:hypothetical protein n=1 Tax=Streptomyces anulatus TaxID=1892 RepID=UPI00225B9A62|nr:hypothetical protein [Streptomyces anulatus]MCX4502741.1 hypothetical protein [Streptomyces anulatus]
MNAAEYRAAAERIVTRDTYRFGGINPDDFRKAEILAQLAVSAAISEAAEARTPQHDVNADFEEADAAEYARFNTEMDAAGRPTI